MNIPIDPLAQYANLDLLYFFIPKLIMATVVGGVVGLERELRHKVLGLKTNILTCAGSTIFTAMSILLAHEGDPTRIISQIVTGIGFLGVGAIFKTGDKVHGLTTAAFLWVVAALGVVIGSGGGLIAIPLAVGMILVIELLSFVECQVKKSASNEQHSNRRGCAPGSSLGQQPEPQSPKDHDRDTPAEEQAS